jgi:hypothetical protein
MPPSIEKCLTNLRKVIADDGVYYTTYWETNDPKTEEKSAQEWKYDHAFGGRIFLRSTMENFGRRTGWSMDYIGDWNHPKGQIIVRYRPA